MTGAYVLAGELARTSGRYSEAFANYERTLRRFIDNKQRGAERFAGAFAPKTRWGLLLRNQIINAAAIPRFARIAFGRNIVDRLQLPNYSWKVCPIA
jgi:2-polyprenyl-6-methoxyphenol hydroxylase-like FAD-dependent oxidoreductase